MSIFFNFILWAKQVERDPEPLYRAAKELINMQLESGEFPQQASLMSWEFHLIFSQKKFIFLPTVGLSLIIVRIYVMKNLTVSSLL